MLSINLKTSESGARRWIGAFGWFFVLAAIIVAAFWAGTWIGTGRESVRGARADAERLYELLKYDDGSQAVKIEFVSQEDAAGLTKVHSKLGKVKRFSIVDVSSVPPDGVWIGLEVERERGTSHESIKRNGSKEPFRFWSREVSD